VQLRQHNVQLEALRAQVMVISFGPMPGAQAWLKETGASFTLLLDPDRAAYRAYDLEHSLVRSWGPGVWLRYAQLLLAGRRWRGIQGDSGQLGGDIVVDSSGIIRFVHRSHDPTDRPAVRQLLTELKSAASAKSR